MNPVDALEEGKMGLFVMEKEDFVRWMGMLPGCTGQRSTVKCPTSFHHHTCLITCYIWDLLRSAFRGSCLLTLFVRARSGENHGEMMIGVW